MEVKFMVAPIEAKAQKDFFEFVMHKWLKEKLENGEYKPSPRIRILAGGHEKGARRAEGWCEWNSEFNWTTPQAADHVLRVVEQDAEGRFEAESLACPDYHV